MKQSILILISLFIYVESYSQRVINERIDLQDQTRIAIDSEHACVTIETWDSDYISFTGEVNINENLDNDAFTYKIDPSSNTIRITTDLDEDKTEDRVIVTDSDGKKIVFTSKKDTNCNDDNYSNISVGTTTDIKLVIKIPRDLEISATGLYGSFKIVEPQKSTFVNNTYASVDIICDDDVLPNLDITSTYAAVDLALPDNMGADLDMDTDYGKMFSDFEFTLSGGSLNSGFGQALKTKLNGGGNKVSLTSGYANIYLRKK